MSSVCNFCHCQNVPSREDPRESAGEMVVIRKLINKPEPQNIPLLILVPGLSERHAKLLTDFYILYLSHRPMV